MVLNLVGSGDMYESVVPDIDGDFIDDPAIYFDVKLVNMKNQQVIGSPTFPKKFVISTMPDKRTIPVAFLNRPVLPIMELPSVDAPVM